MSISLKNEVDENVILKLDIYDADKVNILYTIEYEEGMIWAEWLESKYNTSGFTVEDRQSGGGPEIFYVPSVYNETNLLLECNIKR